MNSTSLMPCLYMWFTALLPPPPTPITLMMDRLLLALGISNLYDPVSNMIRIFLVVVFFGFGSGWPTLHERPLLLFRNAQYSFFPSRSSINRLLVLFKMSLKKFLDAVTGCFFTLMAFTTSRASL